MTIVEYRSIIIIWRQSIVFVLFLIYRQEFELFGYLHKYKRKPDTKNGAINFFKAFEEINTLTIAERYTKLSVFYQCYRLMC